MCMCTHARVLMSMPFGDDRVPLNMHALCAIEHACIVFLGISIGLAQQTQACNSMPLCTQTHAHTHTTQAAGQRTGTWHNRGPGRCSEVQREEAVSEDCRLQPHAAVQVVGFRVDEESLLEAAELRGQWHCCLSIIENHLPACGANHTHGAMNGKTVSQL